MPTNSPTQRLVDLLPKLVDAAGRIGNDPPITQVLPVVFGGVPSDLLAHHQTYVRILNLVKDARREVFSAYHDEDTSEAEQADVIQSAMLPLNPPWSTLLGNSIHSRSSVLQQISIPDIRLLNNSLKRFFRVAPTQDDAVAKAKELIAKANRQIGSAGLPPALVAIFHDGTARVLKSLETFDSLGPDETVESVAKFVATTMSYSSQVPDVNATAWRESLSLVANIIGVVQYAIPVLSPLLAQLATKLLGG